ncbi:MAG: hypothetical protein R2843_00120 [Thermomicrobiales bacterium]
MELVEIDSAIFDSSPGNEQGWYLFYRDAQMLTIGPTSPFPFDFLGYWYAGLDGEEHRPAGKRLVGFEHPALP